MIERLKDTLDQAFDVHTGKVLAVATGGTTASVLLTNISITIGIITGIGTALYVWVRLWRLWKGNENGHDK